jgi:hypothetical protein
VSKRGEREIYARFRIAMIDDFRDAFSYAHYRRWGQLELWEGGRYVGAPPARQRPSDRIEIWLNWELVGAYRSRAEAQAHVRRLIDEAPASLYDLTEYLDISP